jgi:hypothetical protein
LQDIINTILRRGRTAADSNIACEINGDRKPLGDRTDTARPDGWLSRLDDTAGGRPRWENIFLSMEFKKGRSRYFLAAAHDVRYFGNIVYLL